MKAYELIDDSKNFFVLQAPNGSRVRIAKNGLSSATSQKIQGMAKGGKVEYSASPENTLNQQAVDTFKKAFAGEKEKPKEQPAKKVAQFNDGGVVYKPDEPQKPKPLEINLNLGGGQPAQAQPEPPPAIARAMELAQTAMSTPAPQAQPAVMQEAPQQAPMGSARNELENVPKAIAQPDMFQNINMLQATPLKGTTQAISDLQAAADQGTKDLDKQSLQLQAAESGYAKGSEFAQNYAAHQVREKVLADRRDDIYNKITNFEFQPKTMFSGGNFLQNIGTALSVLAGGVSQGLTGAKTNPVMDYIDKQIELDNQKQKQQFGKLENQYTILRQEGHSEQEAMAMMRADKLATIQALLHINESKTKNLQTKIALKQNQATIASALDNAVKQAATQQTLRANLLRQSGAPGTSGTSGSAGMMKVSSDTQTSSPNVIANKFETLAKSIPGLALEKEDRKKAVEEVQRLGEAHRNVNGLLEDFKNLMATRKQFRNVFRDNPYAKSIMANSIPFMKTIEGKPQEFEGKAVEHLLPDWRDNDKDAEVKLAAFRKWLENGSVSAHLESLQIPYPKLRLGGDGL